ncbi:MAG TPA: type II toxin-antitoxin system RelE/ParE family toxin [Candidatus Methylacidiphilales bacterium]|nr:type II toxin-antitoxin system RelE/ParE family toxin [Candidatus Methylacidiphilales bacterium]
MNGLSHHPEALEELAEAVTYYLQHASHEVASDFDASVEKGVADIRRALERYPLWENTRARKYVVPRFPYLIFYVDYLDRIRVLAVAHTSRRPGYWKTRIAVD